MNLSILYRGPLSSCNYGCEYCPFAKRIETPEEHDNDEKCLVRFVEWVDARRPSDRISVFFTPWGEALPHARYQEAIRRLSHMSQVVKVAAQTNLSCRLAWLTECQTEKIALWCTYHPGQTTREKFLAQCAQLRQFRVAFSVGVVGLKEHFREITELRAQLPSNEYLWINAYKREKNYYSDDELLWLERIDPLFRFNNIYHPSFGKECRAGSSVISVNGEGVARRCHFIEAPIGNIYDADFENQLKRSPCTASSCGCHIGYVHMDSLGLYEVFGDRVLERIPKEFQYATPVD